MKRVLSVLCTALLLSVAAACTPDLTGIEEASDYSGELVEALVVDQLVCNKTVAAVGEVVGCFAFNPLGGLIKYDGVPVVRWGTSNIFVAQVDLSGNVTAIAPDTARITVYGARNSSASVLFTIQ